MPVFLLVVSVVIFACVLLNRVSSKLGIPMLLAFILLGMLFGSDGLLQIEFDDYGFAEQICSVALIFIMFYGGFGTNWKEARPVAVRAVLLSSLGVVLTAGLTGLFCRFALGFGWIESFLTGSVISSTDAASVFSILRSKKLNLRYNTASLLELESGSNDPFSYMLAAVFIAVCSQTGGASQTAYLFFAQITYGIAAGAIISLISVWMLKHISFSGIGFSMVFMVGVAILSYAAPAAIGGNGYLSVYIVGIVLGNSDIGNKKSLVGFLDGITSLMQMLIFFLLGLLAFPSRLSGVALPALLIALFITFVGRPLSVFAILAPFRSKLRQILLVSWAGLRGAASIVFAIMAMTAVKTENDLFHTVFFIVLFSILLQGSLIPLVSKKLGMIDESLDVMKTFTDYSDEAPVQFVQFSLPEAHPWCGSSLKDVILPPETLAVLIQRRGMNIVPNGRSVLLKDDILILSALSPDRIEGVKLSEKRITSGDGYDGKTISQLPKQEGTLVIMIQRGRQIIIPDGDVRLHSGDVLVINRTK